MVSFKTRRGRCILDEEKLYLSSSALGMFKRLYEGSKAFFGLYIFSMLYLAYIAYTGIITNNPYFFYGVGLGLVLVAGMYVVNYFRGFAYDSVINLGDIKSIKPVEGSLLTSLRFIVKFEKNGEIRNRYIMMPSVYGREEFEKAKETFEKQGLPLEENSDEQA